mmetsp:Transcript_187/g.322  ORF Transcript_187/g.322 Transcript_187/m.322 type:complete len:232 (-) Transcript_187:604-1299(-)
MVKFHPGVYSHMGAQTRTAVAIGTLGMSYAAVPLYRVFCRMTGFGGTVKTSFGNGERGDPGFLTKTTMTEIQADKREITIRFNADVTADMPWRFTPSQMHVKVLPGETALAFYDAENRTDEEIIGISSYNVAPAKAGIYFNKIQCFCFEEQRLKPHERVEMPVFFFLDPEFGSDPKMSDVDQITLSYTFYRADNISPEELQRNAWAPPDNVGDKRVLVHGHNVQSERHGAA